jgi:hypothetical protein
MKPDYETFVKTLNFLLSVIEDVHAPMQDRLTAAKFILDAAAEQS